MRLTRHPPDKQIQIDYSLHQQRLEQVQSVKYLDINVTANLDWGQYISEISSKATKRMGFFFLCKFAMTSRHTKKVA